MSDEAQEDPGVDGPDPRTWPGNPMIAPYTMDVEVADAYLELLSGKTPLAVMTAAYEEARNLVRALAAASRERLALALLDAFGVPVPPERGQEDEPLLRQAAPEAAGGFRGDIDGPGNRDHV